MPGIWVLIANWDMVPCSKLSCHCSEKHRCCLAREIEAIAVGRLIWMWRDGYYRLQAYH
ncbi:hypothetical protein [Nostoc sp. UHCC 0251]|uniref:hypothetical protein n=1 Tax=Nostoc sp. UHCC 0251 TaxID=3110240 RepID=UPI002B21F719|nr:hypothetical protein [Nostoc sp. UHCC 0251]